MTAIIIIYGTKNVLQLYVTTTMISHAIFSQKIKQKYISWKLEILRTYCFDTKQHFLLYSTFTGMSL